ncbi:MAG: ABC transporter substrate-binding protein, partial [Chloroflexota bacterium]
MKLAKFGAFAAVAALAFSACGAAGSTPPTDALGVVTIPSGEKIHLAFWGVLSGADASLGQDSLDGALIAIADKGKVAGHDINLTTEDGLCTVDGGAAAAAKMAADNTIVGLVGS